MALWHRIEALVGDSCGFRHTGYVYLAENAADMEKLEARAGTLRALGFTHETMITREEARRRVPAAAGHIVGGLASDTDGFASPYRTTMAFRRRAAALGAVFLEETRALGADRGRGTLAGGHHRRHGGGGHPGQLRRRLGRPGGGMAG